MSSDNENNEERKAGENDVDSGNEILMFSWSAREDLFETVK